MNKFFDYKKWSQLTKSLKNIPKTLIDSLDDSSNLSITPSQTIHNQKIDDEINKNLIHLQIGDFSKLHEHLTNTTIVITGGLGYIGTNLLIELERRIPKSTHIIVIDNSSNCKNNVVGRIETVLQDPYSKQIQYHQSTDLCNQTKVEDIFDSAPSKISLVIHLAALKSVGESVSNPLKYYENNLVSTITLLKVMDKFDIDKLIFASSAAVYGPPIELPITETHPLQAISPYGKSKEMCEDIIKSYCARPANWNGKFKCIALRYFNPAGGHPCGYASEDCIGVPSNLMPYVAQVASKKRQNVNVYGSDYDTHDGSGVRDYIHVYDLVNAHFFAMNYLYSAHDKNLLVQSFDVFNIGTGIGTSVFDIMTSSPD